MKGKKPASPAALPALPADARHIYPLPAGALSFEAIDEDLPDLILDLEGEPCALRLENEGQLSLLEENLSLLASPLALGCDDEALLEKALRIYNGRALIAAGFDAERLCRTYGALCL